MIPNDTSKSNPKQPTAKPFSFDDDSDFPFGELQPDESKGSGEEKTAQAKPLSAEPFSFDEESDFPFGELHPAESKALAEEKTVHAKQLATDSFSFDEETDFALFGSQQAVSNTLGEEKISQAKPLESASFSFAEDSDRAFVKSQSSDSTEYNGEKTKSIVIDRFMECICPKCAGKIEIEFSLVTEKGLETCCSSCNKQIHIIRESCACRAKRKSNEINCATCGKQLDKHSHCHSCGMIFPDYFVTVNPEDARRKARNKYFQNKLAAIRNFNFSFKPAFESRTQDFAYDYAASSKSIVKDTGESSVFSRKVLTLVVSFLVVVSLIASGAYAYNNYKSGKIYAENYFKTLYCIKTGIEMNLNTCASIKAEWDSALQSGRSFTPSTSSKDEAKSTKLRTEIVKLLLTINNPPKKYGLANEKLFEINKIYLDTESLLQTKPKTLEELSSSADTLSQKMGKASQDLKANLPDALKQELETARAKYRGMKDF